MLRQFFLFCSGIDQSLLEKCPSDTNKYIGIGATVFFTGILAFFSSAYALFTVFDSYFASVIFGLVWGLMIFNLDRYIVSSMKSKGSVWKDFGVAFPRLLMAVLLALVISKPLELKIFEKEINAELIVMEQEKYKEQEDKVAMRYQPSIEAIQEEVKVLKEEIEIKTKARNDLDLMAIQEADGTGGSGNKNLGPIYRAKKEKADAAQLELDNLLATHIPLIAEKENAVKEMQTQIQAEITALERGAFGGIAARMDALDRLTQNSEAIWLANLFIMLLFISIETAPIFVKLISSRSPYDYLLHEHEHIFEMANRERTTLLTNVVRNAIMTDTEIGVHRANAKVKAEKAIIDEKLRQRLDGLEQGNLSLDDQLSF
jgi:uncharacterized protein DUF4407